MGIFSLSFDRAFVLENWKFFKSHSNDIQLRFLGEFQTLMTKIDFKNSKSACHVVKNAKNYKIVIFFCPMTVFRKFLVSSKIYQDSTGLVFIDG